MRTMTQHSVPYASGVGLLNCDLLFSGLPRLPVEGEELYAQGFDMQLGGGLPATMIHLARLGVPVDFSTFLGKGNISAFIAGLMYGLYHDAPLTRCVALGNIMGGVCVQHVGCLTGRITAGELEAKAQRILDNMEGKA